MLIFQTKNHPFAKTTDASIETFVTCHLYLRFRGLRPILSAYKSRSRRRYGSRIDLSRGVREPVVNRPNGSKIVSPASRSPAGIAIRMPGRLSTNQQRFTSNVNEKPSASLSFFQIPRRASRMFLALMNASL